MPQAELQLSEENEPGELMSFRGAEDAFALIPAPWEQPGKGEGAGPRRGSWAPLGGLGQLVSLRLGLRARPADARPPRALLPLALGRGRRAHPAARSLEPML